MIVLPSTITNKSYGKTTKFKRELLRMWDEREYDENFRDENLMKSVSNCWKHKMIGEWLMDGSFSCCVDMSVLGCLLQVHNIRKTCGVAFV